MLQKFYIDNLQTNYIKYILKNSHIPMVPFTNNIIHVTKGNTYIHDGYFVTAKISDAIDAIKEDIEKDPSTYNKYFIKHNSYVFGEFYPNLTTTYTSNINGYDSITHYYLGEYLRAYKAYYNIDLMPYYNCFSNEYIDYLNLKRDAHNNYKIILEEKENPNFNIISVPIKFCQKYTIAIQCPYEVNMIPVFIGKKGILKTQTQQLHNLNYWGKSYPNINFKSPILFESPHINGISDTTQQMLQTYDKYLRLLIQIPKNLKSSIVVLEGDFHNNKNYSEKIINKSKEDVMKLWETYYSTKIPYNDQDAINIPNKSTLICSNIKKQKIYLNYDNVPILNIEKDPNTFQNVFQPLIKFELTQDQDNYLKYLINIKSISPFNDENGKLLLPLNSLMIAQDQFGSNFNKQENKNAYYRVIVETSIFKDIDNKSGIDLDISKNYLELDENKLKGLGTSTPTIILKTLDKNNNSILQLIAKKDNSGNLITYNVQELAFYADINNFEGENKDIIIRDINGNDLNIVTANNNQISIPLQDSFYINYNIISNPLYKKDLNYNYDNWELKSPRAQSIGKFSDYLNQNMYSNLSLLYFNNNTSYAFSSRLLEYLLENVISSNDEISKNIKRIQNNSNIKAYPNGIWDDGLRINVFDKVIDRSNKLMINPPLDINGFVDKDSEKLLNIKNIINQDIIWDTNNE